MMPSLIGTGSDGSRIFYFDGKCWFENGKGQLLCAPFDVTFLKGNDCKIEDFVGVDPDKFIDYEEANARELI